MESQFLIMKLQKLTFPIKDISEHQLIFFDFDDPRLIPFRKENRENQRNLCVESSDYQSILAFDDFEDLQERCIPNFSRKYFVNEKGIIEYVNPFCNDCYSRKVVKWNHTTRFGFLTLFRAMLKSKDINVNLVGNCSKLNLKDNLKEVVIFQNN